MRRPCRRSSIDASCTRQHISARNGERTGIGHDASRSSRRSVMAFRVHRFDNVQVLQVGVSGPGAATALFIVTGVAILNFPGLLRVAVGPPPPPPVPPAGGPPAAVPSIARGGGDPLPVEGGGVPLSVGT